MNLIVGVSAERLRETAPRTAEMPAIGECIINSRFCQIQMLIRAMLMGESRIAPDNFYYV